MPFNTEKSYVTRQWQLLLVYNIYRLLSVLVFLCIYLFHMEIARYSALFFSILLCYFSSGLLFLYFNISKTIPFDRQVFISGTIDVIAIAVMLGVIVNLQTAYGIMLLVSIAALSMLVPGRLAIYFAALATWALLSGNLIEYFTGNAKDLGVFFYSGIYCAGFFATSLTALRLAKQISASEHLAEVRSYELAEMQKINGYIVEHMHSGVLYVDAGKHIKLMNSAAKRLLNLDKNSQTDNLQQLPSQLNEKFDNFMLKIKEGETVAQAIIDDPYLRVHFYHTDDPNNAAVFILLDDMVFISQQAQQLKLASLGRFSASIAHELRNPLGAISHAVQLIGEEEGLNQEDARLKQMVIKNCDRMNQVIKNVLQLSRREKSKPQCIEIYPFLEQFKHDFCLSNTCDLMVTVPENNGLSVVFDRSQLEQILVILCDNAMLHGKDDLGQVKIDIIVKLNSYHTLIQVQDSGKGISPKHVDDIFEPFFTTLRSGTGMGLFIAKDLCEINQARLSLNNVESGTTFSITINSVDEALI